MIHNLKPYPAYKDSGVPWLGEVPEHWEVKRLKRVAKINPSKSESRAILESNVNVTFLPMGKVGTDGRIDAKEVKPVSAVSNGLTYFRREDVLVAKITPCFENGKGACLETLPTEVGFGSTEFIVLRPIPTVFPKFLYYITTLQEFRTLGTDSMTGAAGQQRVPTSFVGNFQTAIPSLSEQSAIIQYINYIDRRVRRHIRAKQKLIKLLEEQKQAIIHKAVTKGLDPNIKLKNSGVEWLGNVPEHWKITVAKRVCNVFIPQRDKPELNDIEGIPWVTLENVGNIFVEKVKFFVKEEDAKKAGSRILPSGSIVASCVGRFGITSITTEPVIINQQIQAYIPKESISTMFFRFCVQVSKPYFEMQGNSTTLAYVDREAFGNMPLLLPPTSEQNAIVEALNIKLNEFDRAVTRLQTEIFLLREYRTCLISDIVTGKLDVREAVKNLPEEIDEIEILEDELAGDEENTEENPESEPEEE